jgi:hypothetical protein
MFRFVEASKEWKERGTGVVILVYFLALLYQVSHTSVHVCRGRSLLEAQRQQEDPRAYACGENLEGSRQSPTLVSMHSVHARSLYIMSVYGLLGDFNAW